jgi:uroporphyrinogen-III synthase
MLLINTRPADRAHALNAALIQQGIDVISLPLLRLSPCALTESLIEQFFHLVDAQVIVVVSPMAVQVGMQYLQQLKLDLKNYRHISWIAVGQATADALAQYDIHSYVPKVETSEGMLQLPILQQLSKPVKIAFWRGEGGRQFMMQQLQEVGHHIENVLLYTRHCPEDAAEILKRHLLQLQQSSHTIVLMSSEASWHHWQQLKQAHAAFPIDEYWVLGERVANVLSKSVKNIKIKVLSSLKVHDVLAELQR